MNAVECPALTASLLFTVNFAKGVDAWTAQNTSCVVMMNVVRSTALNAPSPAILDSSINAMTAKRNTAVLAIHWKYVKMTEASTALIVTKQDVTEQNYERS